MPAQQRSDEEAAREFETAPKFPGGGAEVLTLALDIQLTTVLYGGGAKAGYPDEITPFRSSSVRGHLRFWWRATRGAKFGTWEELREEEAKIWGDADHPSPVRVRVECPDSMKPKRFPLRKYEKDLNRRYALFPPYEEKVKNLDEDRLQEGGGFQLRLSWPKVSAELRGDIDAALWAWLNFGGVGARTRRGAGALYCAQYARWDTSRILGDGKPRDWPVMKGAILIRGPQRGWPDCWDEVLRFYREFRQDRVPKFRGKTQWPEADQIRGLRQRGEKDAPDGFPRGMLGLPILFHFKDRWDPPEQMLNVADRDGRMASPVILRPLAISKDQARPSILLLNSRKPGQLYLHEGTSSLAVPDGRRNAIEELLSRAEGRWNVKRERI